MSLRAGESMRQGALRRREASSRALRREGAALDVAALPSFGFSHRSLMWWGTLGLIAIESTVFALAIVSYFYLRTQADALEWMARELVQIDCPFRILHPPELREAVRGLAREISRQANRAPRRPAPPARSSGARVARQTAGESRQPPAPVAAQTQ